MFEDFTDRLMDSFWAMLLTIVLGTIISVYGIISVVSRATFTSEIAGIEQVRKDIETVGVSASEGLVAQAAKINRDLAETKVLNQTWWADFAISDGWMRIQPIEMPKGDK